MSLGESGFSEPLAEIKDEFAMCMVSRLLSVSDGLFSDPSFPAASIDGVRELVLPHCQLSLH